MSTITYRTNPRGKGSYGSMNLPGKPQERFGVLDMLIFHLLVILNIVMMARRGNRLHDY